MLFSFQLTVPANTPATAPVELEIPLAPGRVSQVGVQFPDGCVNMVRARIFRSGHQVWPANPDEYLRGNGYVITWPEDYDLRDDPFGFIVRADSPDTSYPHILTFSFALLSLGGVTIAPATTTLWERLRELINP